MAAGAGRSVCGWVHVGDAPALDGTGRAGCPHLWRPDVRIRSLDSKRPLIHLSTQRTDPSNRTADNKAYPGHFVDVRAAAYAFSDRGHTLESACEAFGVERPKRAYRGEHGVLTAEYIDYNRDDVGATYRLYQKLAAEHARHPVDLPLTQCLSPAAIGKAYLRAMGIKPILGKCPDFPVERIGQATTAYYGGRAECRVRLAEVPVSYLDVSSMYPLVFSLGKLWRWVICRRLRVVRCRREATALLRSADFEQLLDPAIWPSIAGVFCRIRPSGQLLPVRAPYSATGWQIGLNYLMDAPRDLWYTLADLIANHRLGGPPPEVLEAFRIIPDGVQKGLRSTQVRGTINVDPRNEDFFVHLVEERRRVARDASLDVAERTASGGFLKTLANAASYGIWAEMRDEPRTARGSAIPVAGLDVFSCHVQRAERIGEFCFPPLAATVTGLARLMLAVIQAEVEALGGTYLACDTDSLIVVSSEIGHEMELPTGETIHALSWPQVSEIQRRLNRLNPFDRDLVPELLKLEDDNFARGADGSIDRGRRIALHGVAISAKRFALYEHGHDGETVLRKRSEHGLGALLSPLSEGGRAWIDEVWLRIVARARGRKEPPIPDWYALPALSHVSASSAAVLQTFRGMNTNQPYAMQVKPANFLLLAHDDPLVAVPPSVDRDRLTLIAPFSNRPSEWLNLPFCNRFSGDDVRVTTRDGGSPDAVRIKTYGDVIAEYGTHPEAKSADADGNPCTRSTIGLLRRLRVKAARVRHIGKEAAQLEAVDAGAVRDFESPVPEYLDERGEWEAALPVLRAFRDAHGWRVMSEASGLSERALRDALNRGRFPHRTAREALLRTCRGPRVAGWEPH